MSAPRASSTRSVLCSNNRITAAERSRAGPVADRVDRPGDVVQGGDAHQAGPEQPGQRPPPGRAHGPAERCWCGEGEHRPARLCRSMRVMSGSASRSGANRAALVSSRPNSQPMWACQKPRASAAAEVPDSQGECGSFRLRPGRADPGHAARGGRSRYPLSE